MKFLRKKEDGSITLEAAVFMPFFILFLVFLIYMIKFALTDIALNRAATETAKQIATQMYPAQVVVDEVTTALEGNQKYKDMKTEFDASVVAIEESVRATLGEDTLNDLKANAGATVEDGVSALASSVLTPMVQSYLEVEDSMNIVESDNVRVVQAKIPDVFTGSNAKVEITIEYELDLPIPFLDETFIIHKFASERAWIGS